jgi:signal transduction histidine kinase
MKTRFLSYTTHELRVPIHSILAISSLLLDRLDGDLSAEQEKQVTFIRRAAEDLIALVNDLLDLAKIEAGKITVQCRLFEVPALFGALRSILRPVAHSRGIELVFEEPAHIPLLLTDEGKVSQILRNLISNALKFTEGGEVRVSAALTSDATAVRFAVADRGIGIAPEHHERIFEEFVQMEHALQGQVKGTGLGLPLCKQLATLLGGHIAVHSTPGKGAIFSVVIPRYYQSSKEVCVPDIEAMQERPGHIETAGTESD